MATARGGKRADDEEGVEEDGWGDEEGEGEMGVGREEVMAGKGRRKGGRVQTRITVLHAQLLQLRTSI